MASANQVLLIFTFIGLIFYANGQAGLNPCGRVYHHTRRSGMYVIGQFQLPLDTEYPKLKLEVRLNRPVHSFSVRQLRARDTGAHREFMFDSMAAAQNNVITLNSVIRLRSIFAIGGLPRVVKVVHNGKVLCGGTTEENNHNEDHSTNTTIIVTPKGSSTTKSSNRDIFLTDSLLIEDDEADDGDILKL